MAYKLNVSLNYGTHLPALIKAMERTSETSDDVLELGTGLFSTPFLHYKCILDNRKLVSYENFKSWYDILIHYGYEHPNHEINLVDKYADAPIVKPWGVVLIDQTPDSSRVEEIKRLAYCAKYIIIHDSNGRQDKTYHYSEIYPLFKWRTIWDSDRNHATVLSNFVNLENFWQ